MESFSEISQAIREKRKTKGSVENLYKDYLLSDQWREKKALVIKRADCKCDGCGRSVDLEVHHLTYERVGCELLTDLAAYCHTCHRLAHGEVLPSIDLSWREYLFKVDAPKPKNKSDMSKDELLKKVLG